MSEKNTGGPAFPRKIAGPCEVYGVEANQNQSLQFHGMTLRDYFAAKAMQGLLAQFQGCANGCDPAHHAKWSYEMADAMIAARSQP